MPRAHSTFSTIGFAFGVCLACSLLVTGSRVMLLERQAANVELDRRFNVLVAAGLAEAGERIGEAEIQKRFTEMEILIWDADERRLLSDHDPEEVAGSREMVGAPENDAGLREIPRRLIIYRLRNLTKDGKVVYVLPVWGQGLWSTMRAYLAVDEGGKIHGVAFYEQAETPGLGGEVSNPRWAAAWVGVEVYDQEGSVAFRIGGKNGDDPNRVDALSGATLTSRGVSELIRFWLGEHGYRSLLKGDDDG